MLAYLIINYNDYLSTSNLIENIKNYKIIDKILIVDNNSKDAYKLKKLNVEVIYENNNLGYAHAINIGCIYLNKLGYKYVIISNSDVIINSEEDIKKLLNTFDNDTAIVAPKIIENENINASWRLPSIKDEIIFNIPYFGKKHRSKLSTYKSGINNVDVVSGCFFMANLAILKSINYLDEVTFLYYEENILSKKLKDINKKIILNTNASVIHKHAITIDKNINKIKKYKILKKSQYYYCKKYLKANIFELFILKVTYLFTYIVLYIYYKILDLRRDIYEK